MRYPISFLGKLGIAIIVLAAMPVAYAFAAEPVITGATNITTEATSTSGASVTFSVTASDTDGSALTPSCAPSSGTLFAFGTTTVTCTATSAINTASSTTAHFDVGVADKTSPIITPPADQWFTATKFPATPTLTFATASDTVDANPTVTVSTTTFDAGTTTVMWTSKDNSGNIATTTSNVGVFLLIDSTVDVPANCDATDTDGVVHSYQATSSSSYIAICAVEAALGNGSVANVQLSNAFPSLGLFLTTVAGVMADPNSQYWALYQNGGFASLGLSQLAIVAGDTIMLQLHDFSDNNLGSQATLKVHSLIATTTAPTNNSTSAPAPSGGGGGSGSIPHPQFNISSALSYLASKQHADGSFGSPMLSDWAALAFSAKDQGTAKINLRKYLLSSSPALSSATDYERHAMALEALGINPYSDTATNYIDKILGYFDGTQVGETSLDNDDIFALFPLLHAGYSANDDIIQKIVAFILSKQLLNGSWDGNVDMTAAAVQALSQVSSLPNVSAALDRAKNYLHSKQEWSGGFGNSFSTSWALQAISSLNESPTGWSSSSGNNPADYLTGLQQTDGGVEPNSSDTQTRIWATEYAIPAVLGKTWDSLLSTFAKPGNLATSGGVATIAIATSTSASSTVQINATNTAIGATSTPETTPQASSTVVTIAESAPAAISSPQSPKELKKKAPEKTTESDTKPKNKTAANSISQLAVATVAEQTKSSGTQFFIHLWETITSFFRGLF